MKAFEEWFTKENIRDDDIEEFKKENKLVTQEDVLDLLAQTVWVAALEWVKKEVISLDERGDISREIINRELRK